MYYIIVILFNISASYSVLVQSVFISEILPVYRRLYVDSWIKSDSQVTLTILVAFQYAFLCCL